DETFELGEGELLEVAPGPSLPDEEITCLREGVIAGVARLKAELTRPATAFPRRTKSSLNTTSSEASSNNRNSVAVRSFNQSAVSSRPLPSATLMVLLTRNSASSV